jgi:hypothetical protein
MPQAGRDLVKAPNEVAGLTQLVEYHPSKVAVDGSSPLARSTPSFPALP